MNRPPPPGRDRPPGPEPPWYLRRPTSGDPTGMVRPVAPQRRPPPDPRQPPPMRPAPPPPEIAWHQRPVRPFPPARPGVFQGPPPPRAGATARDRRPLWVLGGAAAVAIVVSTAVIISGTTQFGGGQVLDVAAVQAGVARILSDPAGGYGANAVGDVSCNQGRNPSARRGTTFDCQLTVNGAARQVSVLVSDDAGTYEVDRPR